ncbi:MAG: hypothetical protein Phog2KO_46280 [Phototrophicaceae bacterium]
MVAVNYLKTRNGVVEFSAGDVIFTAGDMGQHMYGVLEGRVQVVHNGLTLDTIEAGGILGEDIMLGNATYTSTAIAITDCTLSAMDRHQFLWLVQETPTFATQVMSAMSERLKNVSKLLD